MANLTESSTWEAGIYQLEINDPVDAGTGGNGIANRQAKQLANRTKYLKDAVDTLSTQNTAQGVDIAALLATQIIGYGGRKFKDVVVISVNTTLNQSNHAGKLIVVDTPGVIITVPPVINQGSYVGGTYAVMNQAGGVITFASGGPGNSIIPTGNVVLEDGDFAEVAANGGHVFLVGLRRQSDYVPVGTVMAFAASSPPAGWLACNGAQVSQATYAKLDAVIGGTFNYLGVPSIGNFRLPDLRGEFIRGWDNGRGVDSGRTFGTAQADELKSHFHLVKKNNLPRGTGSNFFAMDDTGVDGSENTESTGGSETRPRNVALMYCIKY